MKINLQSLFNKVKQELFNTDATNQFNNIKNTTDSTTSTFVDTNANNPFSNPHIDLVEGLKKISSEAKELDITLGEIAKLINELKNEK